MPSKSKSQQRFMGMVHAAQKGELENPSKAVKKAAKNMKKGDAKDFAKTKHKGLPEKVDEAWGEKLDIFLTIIMRWLEGQGYGEYEIDAILNDPDNMDLIEKIEYSGGHPIEDAAKNLEIDNIITGMHSAEMAREEEPTYVQESVDYYIKESFVEKQSQFMEALIDQLQEEDLTWEEADFAISQVDDHQMKIFIHEAEYEERSLNSIADEIIQISHNK